MPCDGVVVAMARVNYDLSDFIRSPVGFKAAAAILKQQGIDIEVVSNDNDSATIMVDGSVVRVTPGLISGPNVSQRTVDRLKKAFEDVAGLLNQEKAVEAVRRNATVVSERRMNIGNGYVVMSVRL
jgi:hypothetical protein